MTGFLWLLLLVALALVVLRLLGLKGPLLTMASVHLDASIPNFVVQEYSPVDDLFAAGPVRACVRRDGGYLALPQEPGLGVSADFSGAQPMELTGRPLWRIPLRSDGSVGYAV